jgi:chromosome segregation ATPase
MNRLFFCLLLLIGGVGALLAADPSEQFLNAYQAYQQGEKLERDGNASEALKKYRFANSLLLEVEKNYPSWQKAVVEYRFKKTQQALERLQGEGSPTDASINLINQSPGNPEEIPPEAKGAEAKAAEATGVAPSISIVPPRGNSSNREARSASGDSSAEVRRLKRLLETLRGELNEAKVAMSSEKNRVKDLDNIKWVEERSKLEKELLVTKDQVGSLNEKLQMRDSWENDLKSLQKKLDDTVADKAAFEEECQNREKKKDEANLLLAKQLDEARLKTSLRSEAEQKLQQLSSELNKAKQEVAGMKEQFNHAAQVTRDYETKNEDLKKQVEATNVKLNAAVKQAEELAPLRDNLQKLQVYSAKIETDARDSKQKVSALENESLKVKSDSTMREAALRADLQALEEERNSISAQVTKLKEAALDAARVKGLEPEVESLKKTVLELREKTDLAGQKIEKLRADADASAKAAKASEEKLSAITASNEADKVVLEEERQRLNTKLADAMKKSEDLGKVADTTGPLSKEIEALKERLDQNSKASDAAKAKYDQAVQAANNHQSELQKKLDDSLSLKQLVEKQNSSLQDQLKAAMEKMSAIVDHSNDQNVLRDQLKKLQQQIDSGTAEYAKSQQQIDELKKIHPEQEKMVQKKEQELGDAKKDAEKLRAELAQANQKNIELQHHANEGDDRLKKLQDQLASLSKTIPEKDKELSDAKAEVGKLQSDFADVKTKLFSLQKKSGSGNEQLNALKERLEEKEAQLARYKKKRSKSGGDGNLMEENDLLRGIIVREVKEEARRAQARRLLEDEMKRLNVHSQLLSDQVVVLSSPSAELTPQERLLFKEGQLTVADSGNGKIQESISAKKTNESGAAVVMTNQPSSPSSNQSVDGMVGKGEVPSPDVSSSQATNDISTNTPTNTVMQEIPWEGKLKECLAKAKDEFDRQDYLQSENTFQEALKISPDDYFALSNIGVVEFQLGKMTEAEDFLKRAAAKAGNSSFALTTLGIVHYRQQRLDDAEKVLKQATTINPQDFTAHNYLGIVLAASGKGKAGEKEIMTAIEINPQYADAHFNLAVIYATGKPPAKMMAKKHYAKAIELGAPPDPSLERLVQ